MKNIKLIIGIIIGAIIAGGVVYATTFAGDITYTREGRNDINSVADALNDLYNISTNYILPSGTEIITTNGTYDISNKANVNVNIPTNDVTIISTGTRKSSGSTISVEKDSYLLITSFHNSSVTNSSIEMNNTDMAFLSNGVGTTIGIYKVSDNSVTVTITGGYEFGYINFK